ncbi:MAG: nuclear transport factor 2 family protein [Polyangiales bacterium]
MSSVSDLHASIARRWLAAFNAYDVDALVALYADEATHTSPKIRALHPDTGGKLVGKTALSKWWRDANARLPGLRYELTAVTANDDRVFVEYVRHAPNDAPMPVAEVFDVVDGRIVASRVYHG